MIQLCIGEKFFCLSEWTHFNPFITHGKSLCGFYSFTEIKTQTDMKTLNEKVKQPANIDHLLCASVTMIVMWWKYCNFNMIMLYVR